MDILLHTIALEPARWMTQRVSQKLSDLIPKIARTEFKHLEIFEPHLEVGDEEEIKELLASHALEPVILSSYLQVAPGNTDAENFAIEKNTLIARVRWFDFQKVRIFPGVGVSPKDEATTKLVAGRISQIASELPGVEILLETHDGSIADDPEAMVALVDQIDRYHVGIMWQPSIFQAGPALKQFSVQKDLVRHLHLQNRNPDLSFSTLKEGVVPWETILPQLNVNATLEFVPSGICPVEKFDIDTSLDEAVAEAEYIRSISSG